MLDKQNWTLEQSGVTNAAKKQQYFPIKTKYMIIGSTYNRTTNVYDNVMVLTGA